MKLIDLFESNDYLKKLYKVASSVRYWVEHHGFKDPSLTRSSDGYCAIASSKIYSELNKNGIQSTLYVKHTEGGHCYLVTDRGYLIDITADQFDGHPKIYITLNKPKGSLDMWDAKETHNNVKSLIDSLRQHGWHPSAIPYKED